MPKESKDKFNWICHSPLKFNRLSAKMQDLQTLTLLSQAKINWYLRVLNKREDGYHNIESLMQQVDLNDTLVFHRGKGISFHIKPTMDIPIEENLIYKATMALMGHSGFKGGAKITLIKNIPSGAGLGGGSSNAAYTLLGLNKLWGLNLTKEALRDIASTLGSDVPFFLSSSLAIVKGKGDLIEEIPIKVNLPLLIVKTGVSVSTKEAYQTLQRGKEVQGQSKMQAFIDALSRQDYEAMNLHGLNDFEDVVFGKYPELSEIKKDLRSMGALYSLMSGSGSALYGVFKSKEDAQRAAERFTGSFCAVTETI